MAEAPGKYDDMCTYVRQKLHAETVILIVFDGDNGSGFSVQTHLHNSKAFLPGVLEHVAADIRALDAAADIMALNKSKQ